MNNQTSQLPPHIVRNLQAILKKGNLENAVFEEIDPTKTIIYVGSATCGMGAGADKASNKTPEETCQMVLDAGLCGRGGGEFQTGLKWKFAMNTPAEKKYEVCNADVGLAVVSGLKNAKKLYNDYLEKPNSHISHKLLHTNYHERDSVY